MVFCYARGRESLSALSRVISGRYRRAPDIWSTETSIAVTTYYHSTLGLSRETHSGYVSSPALRANYPGISPRMVLRILRHGTFGDIPRFKIPGRGLTRTIQQLIFRLRLHMQPRHQCTPARTGTKETFPGSGQI